MILQPNALARLSATFSTEELRRHFLATGLFQPGELNLRWWEADRTVLGGAVPVDEPLALPNPQGLRSAYFLERREAGLVNLGGAGVVTVDGRDFALAPNDALYLGRGGKSVSLASVASANPARFWIVSYPAHASHPHAHVAIKDARGERLGSRDSSNERTLFRLIHPGTVPTCQLVMGVTRLEPGNVWNSMPPHTHLRRSEVYLYFNLPPGQAVFHFMGEPQATRHLVVHDSEAVLSPPWSIHCGTGTSAYSFVWCMGGENQEFSDMDPAPVGELR
ncbi:MAG TPA: 5-dehydro-4-deoxy-D-glucuronate isomerase [Candidatus Didemnitutus sp.]|nr:5-dehydro-4-deoxy-D-glucuronate isomerase [Candidatus Didemnitutus sp.]